MLLHLHLKRERQFGALPDLVRAGIDVLMGRKVVGEKIGVVLGVGVDVGVEEESVAKEGESVAEEEESIGEEEVNTVAEVDIVAKGEGDND